MKKFLIFVLFFSMFFVYGCGSENEDDPVIYNTDETTDTLSVYIWVSSNTEFFTADEISVIQSCYTKQNPHVDVTWHLIQNSTKENFGNKVNEAKDADVIISTNNMDAADGSNIKIKNSDKTKKANIHSSWCSFGEMYIGIYEGCGSVHFENALKLREQLLNEKPELYKKQRVLMIGNSYTFYNDQYRVLKEICINQGMDIVVDTVVKSSTSLSNVLDENSNEYKSLISKLTVNEYNYVILQEQSTKPIFGHEVFELDCDKLMTLIKSYNPNAKFVLYATWARELGSSFYTENPTYTYKSAAKALIDSYQQVADKYNCLMSYVGVGFYLSHESKNGVRIYQSDLTHPKAAGTYLAALIHAGTMFGIDPLDVTYVPSFIIEASGGDRVQPTKEECAAMREIAHQVLYELDLSVLE